MLRLSFKQLLYIGFLLGLALVLGITYISDNNIKRLQDNNKLVLHTEQVMSTASKILSLVLEAETAQRGYVVTGNEIFLKPYTTAQNHLSADLSKLQELVRDNPSQIIRVDSLKKNIDVKLELVQQTISLRRNNGFNAAADFMRTEMGNTSTIKIRSIINDIISEENRLLVLRENQVQTTSERSRITATTSGIIVALIISILLFYILRTFRKQKEAEARILTANATLENLSAEDKKKNWLLTGSTKLGEQLSGENNTSDLSKNIITSLSNYLKAQIGAIYLINEDKNTLQLTGSYAFTGDKDIEIPVGTGLVGQAALEKNSIIIDSVPSNYLKIQSGLGESSPNHLFIAPFPFNNNTKGVIELGFTSPITDLQKAFFEMVAEGIGVAVNAAESRTKMHELYLQTQQQTEELESQQEELRITNEELLKQAQMLQTTDEELRVQQEELQQINTELEEKAAQLEERNLALEEARQAITIKARELEQSGKYKSQFLANISHELRTPLNSILILARMLNENKSARLSAEEVNYANVIYNAGNDLLTLINDILDLSKIESGKLELNFENIETAHIRDNLKMLFAELAQEKKVNYYFNISAEVPSVIKTDKLRLEQIIKNLLSNAFKFTHENGTVTVDIFVPGKKENFHAPNLIQANKTIAFAVKDTGIGISEDKQKLIFEAFQQADGSTNRKFGGTGLGLSISKDLAALLGGEIHIESTPGQGSIFTLFIPADMDISAAQPSPIIEENIQAKTPEAFLGQAIYAADNQQITTDEKLLLIAEHDEDLAAILENYAHSRGFKTILAHDGETALEYVKLHKPYAIILDSKLPGTNGWEVLKQIKADEELKHISVHILSDADEQEIRAKQAGATDLLQKPVQKERLNWLFDYIQQEKFNSFKNLLIIEDHEMQSNAIKQLLNSNNIKADQAFSGEEGLELLDKNTYDGIILDLNLPGISGLELLDKIKKDPRFETLPVIINTGSEISQQEQALILKYTNALVIKNPKSNTRLLDEVNLYLNKLKKETGPVTQQETLPGKNLHAPTTEKALKGKTVLIVDDDMRNIFALSSALHKYNLTIEIANNGKEALQKLYANKDTDIVLMDIMMPEMGGYEAMRKIREDKAFAGLPIIALTAKAMKNDREKCIEAGASDYIAKPVDINKLISLMRVWLSK